MSTAPEDYRMNEARRIRADLRLALAQADELMRKAEAVLQRTRSRDWDSIPPISEQSSTAA